MCGKDCSRAPVMIENKNKFIMLDLEKTFLYIRKDKIKEVSVDKETESMSVCYDTGCGDQIYGTNNDWYEFVKQLEN